LGGLKKHIPLIEGALKYEKLIAPLLLRPPSHDEVVWLTADALFEVKHRPTFSVQKPLSGSIKLRSGE
jgi:hypothetical protein